MKEELLREYVSSALHELKFSLNKEKPKSVDRKGFLSKIKSLLFGKTGADNLAEEWLEEQELYFDIELSEEFGDKVRSFVRNKQPSLSKRLSDKPEKLEKIIKKALDAKFGKEVRDMASAQEQQLLGNERDRED